MPSIAIVGASSDRKKYGNKAVRAYVAGGWTVYPIHPREETIEGIAAFKRLTDIPDPLDRVALYVPPEVGISLLDDIAAKHPGEVFLNPGSERADLVEAARSKGIAPVLACSIVNVGLRPDMFPDE